MLAALVVVALAGVAGDLVAAMGTGLIGFKWLENHWDSKLNNLVAQKAAMAPPNQAAASALANNNPRRALNLLGRPQA